MSSTAGTTDGMGSRAGFATPCAPRPVAARLAARIARLSLTSRITAYCALFAGVLVGATLGTAHWQLSSALRERAHGELRGEWALASQAVARLQTATIAEPDGGAHHALRGEHPGLSIAVLRPDGSPLAVLGHQGQPLAALTHALDGDDVVEFDWPERLLAAYGGDARTADAAPVRLLVALDRTDDRELLAERRRALAFACLVSVLLIGALARVIAGRALVPLRRFAAEVDGLSATQLGRRLEEGNVPLELRDFARAFNSLLLRLEEAFARLRGFSSDIAHELRAPLAAIAAETQLALARTRSADDYRATLASSAEDLERIIRMVSEMALLAQIENPAAAVQRTLVELRPLCAKLAEFYGLAAEERGIRIRVAGSAVAYADEGLVERAVGNLLSNAIRHTPDNGTIVVRMTVGAAEQARIEVENPGPGIPAALQARLFERFVRGEAARYGERCGLGLAIVRSIMRLHGGTVRVASPPSGPTTFSLQFPA